MDIYTARKLQKILSKCSSANPHIGTVFNNEQGLIYYISHKISDYVNVADLTENLLNGINERRMHGVKFVIITNHPLLAPLSIYPDSKRYGVFLVEIIEVD